MTKLPETPTFSLAGKRALVTGATSGIGCGCAVAVAAAGAEVYLAARDPDRVAKTVADLRQRGWQAHSFPLDIADLEKTAAAINQMQAQHGAFDILVNSAGMARHSPALTTTYADFDQVMRVNLRGAYFLTCAIATGLIAARRPGSLINISSQMGHVGGIERAVYCASKHAVEGFTKAMAIEWGQHDIRVNTIAPTFIRTPLTEAAFNDPQKRAWIDAGIKLSRPGEIRDIMGAVVYLASDAAAMVTGTSLLVDGGWTAD